MQKKLWNNPGFMELGVEKTECLPIKPVCPPAWTCHSAKGTGCGSSSGFTFGHPFKPEPKHKGWW